MMKVYAVVLTFLSLAVSAALATDGRLFLLTFMNLSTTDPSRKGFQHITLSSLEDANFRAVIPGANKTIFGSLNQTNNRRWELMIAEDLAVPKEVEISKTGILVSSDKPISVQASKAQAGTTGGYTAIPITQGATEFFVPAWNFTTIHNSRSHSIFSIISLFDGTCTEVYRILPDGTYVRLWFLGLEEIDVFQALTDVDDYSGIYINSTKPLGVQGGAECAQAPQGKDYCDHIIEQVPPVIDWGTEHIVGPIDGRNKNAGYYIRIYSASDSTQFTATVSDIGSGSGTFSGGGSSKTDLIKRGQFEHLLISNAMTAVIVTCTEPCMVVQYNPGMLAVPGELVDTDPFMTIIPPFDHYKSEYSFGTTKHYYAQSPNPFHAEDTIDYVTVIARSNELSTISLDNDPSALSFNQIQDRPAYSVATRTVSQGIHVIRSTSPDAEILVFVYGHGVKDHTGYGYLGGYKRVDDEIDGDFYDISALEMKFGLGLPISGGGIGTDPTTPAPPGPTTPATDWLSLVRDDEYPVYMVEMKADFFNVERAGKLIERKCTEKMLDQLRDTRMPAMEEHLNSNLLRQYCGTTALRAKLSDGTLYTEYSRGTLSVTIEFTGTKEMTFRSLKACAENIRPHLSELKNWPNTDPYFLHIIRPNTVTADCDPVYFDPKFKEIITGWKCDLRLESVVGASAHLGHSGITLLLCALTYLILRL